MASTATAYRNSPVPGSGKLSPLALDRIDASGLKPGLARTLRHLVIRSQFGPDLWAPTFKISVDAGFHYRTVQRHIDKLERLKVLKLKHSANTHVNGKIRRSATYVLHPDSGKHLAPRQNFEQWKKCNGREAPIRFRPQVAPEPEPVASAKPQPVSVSGGSRAEDRVRKLCQALMENIPRFMLGVTRVSGDHMTVGSKGAFELSRGDPRYRAPMPERDAIIKACQIEGISEEAGREHLLRVGWKFRDGEQP